MTDDSFESWEEEEEPESLRRKWEEEETRDNVYRECPHCGKQVESDSFFCLFCGERIMEASGPLSRLALWTKQGRLMVVVAVLILAFILLALLT